MDRRGLSGSGDSELRYPVGRVLLSSVGKRVSADRGKDTGYRRWRSRMRDTTKLGTE